MGNMVVVEGVEAMGTSKSEPVSDFVVQGEALAMLPCRGNRGKPITVVATKAIRDGFEKECLLQALNARSAPGVSDLILNPDAHSGYGAPIGCVLVSPTHIYPGPVGVDIKCSMSLLQLDLPNEEIADRRLRRALIDAICARTPTGAGKGQRSVPLSRRVSKELGRQVVVEGASAGVCVALGIPPSWASRCEDASHKGHDGTVEALASRLGRLAALPDSARLFDKFGQLGSYGGGNHFGEANVVRLVDDGEARAVASTFGLLDGAVAFLSHCGSRGFGYQLASRQFRLLLEHFERWNLPLPAGDRQLVYAPLGTPEADAYLDDMALGGNFSTVNHLLINALVLEAFQEVVPGVKGELVYAISHNIARQEAVDGRLAWVHRKGATRAFPAGHHALRGGPFAETGHPILLPGNPQAGSAVMVARAGAVKSCYSVNHGAGRAMGRKAAIRALDQKRVDASFEEADILTNCRKYPVDEAPDAYKNFDEVLRSVEAAELASPVARLRARFVIKDQGK